MGTASKEQMAQRMRSFIHLYSDSLQQEENGVAIIVRTDESYIHTQHRNRWVKAYLQRHPGTNQTLLQQEFARHGFQLLYTPPYQCDTQPIEMLWAYVKNYVGRVMGDDHSVAAVTQLTRQGFYGDEANNHAPADAAFCQRLIEHTHKWLNAWIERDEELSGDIRHLDGAVAENDDVWDDLDDAEEDQTEASSDEDSD